MNTTTDKALGAAELQFSQLIHPMAVDEFLQRYWQKEHVVVGGRTEDAFDDILCVRDIDDLLSGVAIPINQVDIGTKSVGVSKASFQKGSYADPRKVLEHHRQGHSIILRSMDKWLPSLARLTNGASRVFNSTATANIYITPAGSQSSTPHWDAHDIFVLQLCGEKIWDLHESLMPLPHPSFEFDARIHPVGPKVGEILISRGQCAYIPRGCVHNPRSTSYSIHIALGVQVKTIDDVLFLLLKRLGRQSPFLRRALPVKNGTFDISGAREMVLEALKWVSNNGEEGFNDVIVELCELVRSSRKPEVNGLLEHLAHSTSLSLMTKVRLFPFGEAMRLQTSHGEEFRLNGISYAVDTPLEQALEFVIENGVFCVDDLPLESGSMKVAFVQRLLDDGALQIAVVP